MSDKGSESSGEWVILGENEELCLDNAKKLPDVNLNYEAIFNAVSESIRSSLPSEELEWQYEQFQDFIPQYRFSYIEKIDYPDFDDESIGDLEVKHAENDNPNNSVSADDLDDDKSLEISPVTKYSCYKHTRNDQLNFILNLMLAVVLASTIGFGIGHFLGWSHKCHKSAPAYSPSIPDPDIHSSQLPHTVAALQNAESIVDQENMMTPAPFSENVSEVSCLDPKDSSISLHQENFEDIVIDPVLPESSILMSEDVQELKTGEINQNNFSDVGLPHVSNILTHVDWSKINLLAETFDKIKEPSERSHIQPVPSIDTEKTASDELFPFDMNGTPLTAVNKYIIEEMSLSSDSFSFKDTETNEKIEFLKQVYVTDNAAYDERNLTNQLRQDLRELIQSLTTIAVARLSQGRDDILSVENSGLIVKYYKDFENLVDLRLSEIDNFVMSSGYKKYEKRSLKHLQKMVYTVINSVDYFMKVNIKSLSIQNKRIVIHKYLNNIDKVIFTFNKRWEKNSRHWSETIKKFNFQEIKEKSFKKEHRHWKRKHQFEKDFRNKKYQRYSVNS